MHLFYHVSMDLIFFLTIIPERENEGIAITSVCLFVYHAHKVTTMNGLGSYKSHKVGFTHDLILLL